VIESAHAVRAHAITTAAENRRDAVIVSTSAIVSSAAAGAGTGSAY